MWKMNLHACTYINAIQLVCSLSGDVMCDLTCTPKCIRSSTLKTVHHSSLACPITQRTPYVYQRDSKMFVPCLATSCAISLLLPDPYGRQLSRQSITLPWPAPSPNAHLYCHVDRLRTKPVSLAGYDVSGVANFCACLLQCIKRQHIHSFSTCRVLEHECCMNFRVLGGVKFTKIGSQ